MTSLPYPDYLDHLRRESARFRTVLTDCDPGARVPACPDWDAADLLWHLAGVQLGWAKVVRHRPQTHEEIDEPEPVRPDSYAGLLDAFDDFSHALATELERADPEDEAWHWSDDHRVATTFRRQAHEALIHRLDAEQTAQVAIAPIDRALAADGVLEVLDVMFGGHPAWGEFTSSGTAVRFALDDAAPIRVALGRFVGTHPSGEQVDEGDLGVVPDDGTPVAATIAGTAADLDVWLWHRATSDTPEPRIDGDPAAADAVLTILRQPLN